MKNFRGDEWAEISMRVLKRDGFKCRKCGKKYYLGVHHIIPWKKNPDNSMKNLITLCSSCHKTMDNDYLRVGETNYVKKLIKENEMMR